MATLDNIPIITKITIPLARGEFAERQFYALPAYMNDLRNTVPALETGKLNAPLSNVAAPLAYFGVYGGRYGFNGLYTTHDPNASAGEIYASMPPEYWAAQGIFHPSDKQKWIDRGVWKPAQEPTK
jgi:hypothetical protein